jgi:hypothetical protein
MKTNILLLITTLILVTILAIFLMMKKDSVAVFYLDKNLPSTEDAPSQIKVLMHDKKNNKLKVNIDGKDLILSTSKLNTDDYKGVVLQRENFVEKASTKEGQDDIVILISDNMLFYDQYHPIDTKSEFKPAKSGYYSKHRGSEVINLNGTYQTNKDDRTVLIMDMKDPLSDSATFSYKLLDKDGKQTGPFKSDSSIYLPLNDPMIKLELEKFKNLNLDLDSYRWMMVTSLNLEGETNTNQPTNLLFISGDLQNILYTIMQSVPKLDENNNVIVDESGNAIMDYIPTNPQVFTKQ